MPELPEVESVRLSLLPHVRGRTILGAEVRRREVVRVMNARGEEQTLPARNQRFHLLQGWKIQNLERRGKQLAIIATNGKAERALVVHLGMTGQLFCLAPGAHLPDPSHVHVIWRLDSGARLVFRDPRRFGGIWALASRVALDERWAQLGPDALSIKGNVLWARLVRTRRAIKSALLDQTVLAGVGNIYADESLFLARIPPKAIAGDLKAPHVQRLADSIRAVLAKAVAAGGSSLADRTYVDGDGKAGRYQLAHAVYSRGGQPCMECRTALRSEQVTNRTTVWCPRCQRLP